MQLLDLYQSRFGAAVKRQGGAWNGPCPICGGEPGKSDRFMIWPDRSENLGATCAAHNIAGIWSCRQCGASGDTIAYLMKIDALDFKAALAELGIEGGRAAHRRCRAPAEPQRAAAVPAWLPREWPEPSAVWCAYAARLLSEAEERIWREPTALTWLARRGITEEAVRTYRIGYLPAESARYQGRYRVRAALGLSPRTGDDGRERTRLFIPRGIVIPTFAPDGRVMNLRFRRHIKDLTEQNNSKYIELEGSCKTPLFLRSSRHTPLAVYFVTEAELDAMLIHHATGGVIGALAVRTNRGKPDHAAHTRLRQATRICVALDYDGPGADGVDFWERTYSNAVRWPTPEGKDPGDAFRLGVDIRDWVAASLPPSVPLPMSQCRQRHDTVAPNPKNMLAFSRTERRALQDSLPSYLSQECVPVDVLRAYLLWHGIPATFSKLRLRNGERGFAWSYDGSWARRHQERFETFWMFQDRSAPLWDWLSDHIDSTITSHNLLYIWGK